MTRARDLSNDFAHVSVGLAITIRLSRVRLRLSQAQLAERTNISRSQVSAIETCRASPALRTLIDIADALGYDDFGAFYNTSLDVADQLHASLVVPSVSRPRT